MRTGQHTGIVLGLALAASVARADLTNIRLGGAWTELAEASESHTEARPRFRVFEDQRVPAQPSFAVRAGAAFKLRERNWATTTTGPFCRPPALRPTHLAGGPRPHPAFTAPRSAFGCH